MPSTTPLFYKTAFIGLGLIGASLAQAMRNQNLSQDIVACDTNPQTLQHAEQIGLISHGALTIDAVVHDCDLVVIGVPVQSTEAVFAALARAKKNKILPEHCIITDVCSTKTNVINACQKAEREFDVRLHFVPAHPIAGAEQSGVLARKADLFAGNALIICPHIASESSTQAVVALWQAVGAQVSLMDSQKHDEVLSLTSHLPHLLSYALTYQLAKDDDGLEIFRYAAGGFRDFSRISASSPIMWHDIFLANKQAILHGLTQYQAILDQLKHDIQNDQSDSLLDTLAIAKNAREYFGQLLIQKQQYKMNHTTPDIVLEPFSVERSLELFALTDKNRAYLKKTLPWLDYIQKPEDTQKFIEQSIQLDQQQKGLHYFIVYQNTLIGILNLREMTQQSALVGYWIDESHQGKNITTQALLQLIAYTKQQNLTQCLILRANPHNIGSNKVALKCGFVFSHVLHNAEILYGTPNDLNVYTLTL